MKLDALLEQLVAFGFEEHEARVYYHMARIAPARASEIAQAADMERTRTYRVLDQLAADGVIERTLERPQRFYPRDLTEVLEARVAQRRAAIEALESSVDDLARRWPRTGTEQPPEETTFRVVQGREQIAGLLGRMVERADREAMIAAPRRGLARLDGFGVLDALLQRAEEDDLLVHVLTNVDREGGDRISRWRDPLRVRHVELPSYHEVVLIDRSEIALFATIDPLASAGTEDRQAVLATNAKDMILGQQALLDRLWDQGLDLAERQAELATGRPADRVEVVRGRWTRLDRMKTMIYRAEQQLRLTATREEIARLESGGVLGVLADRASQGLTVQLIARTDGVKPPAGIQIRSPVGEVDQTTLLIDDREALCVLQTKGEPEALTGSDDWSVWLSVDEELDRVIAMFQRSWAALAGEPAQAA